MLRQTIAPFVDSADREKALQLVGDIQACGISALSARSVLLASEASAGSELASQIRAGLAHDQQPIVEDALDAVALWFFFGEPRGTFPADLLDELLNRILARRQPGARRALEWAEIFARERPDALTGQRRKTLEVALEYLLFDTDAAAARPTTERIAPFTLEEQPDYRALTAGIAGRLFADSLRTGVTPAPVLKRWEEVGKNDLLPEVRLAWRGAITETPANGATALPAAPPAPVPTT